MGSGGLYKDG